MYCCMNISANGKLSLIVLYIFIVWYLSSTYM
jgi:hypothetical protein